MPPRSTAGERSSRRGRPAPGSASSRRWARPARSWRPARSTSETVLDAFRAQAEALAEGGADALLFETFSDVDEARLAVRAAKPLGLPILVSFAFDSGKNKDRTMMGATPEAAGRAMAEEGVDAVGANCGAGPESFPQICRRLKEASGLPGLDQAERGHAHARGRPGRLHDGRRRPLPATFPR